MFKRMLIVCQRNGYHLFQLISYSHLKFLYIKVDILGKPYSKYWAKKLPSVKPMAGSKAFHLGGGMI